MDHREVVSGREFVGRLEHGRDWRGQIEEFAVEEGVETAFFIALGAVQDAEVFFYDQADADYRSVRFDEPLEVAACVGNLSRLDGEPFAHTHAVLTREDGSAVGGHLDAATTFAGELWLREFDGRLEREYDETTELDLWPL